MKLRAGFLKKTDKPLARLPKEKKNQLRNERGNNTTDMIETQGIRRLL